MSLGTLANQPKTRQSANRQIVRDSNLYAIGTLIGFILSGSCRAFLPKNFYFIKHFLGPLQAHHPLMLISLLIISFFFSSSAYAQDSTLSLSIDNPNIEMNVSPTLTGSFAKSNPSTITASTNNATGYTLTIAAGDSTDTYNQLINSSDNTKTLGSITNAITESQFKALDGTAYNNMWGYLPSKYCTADASSACSTNSDFLPSPNNKAGDILDVTNVANTNGSVNEYEIALGARVDTTTKIGAYSNTYIVTLVGNAVPYAITYYDSVIGNMPTDVATTTMNPTESISSNVPTRSGYTFLGWCNGIVAHNADGTDTCSTTPLQPGDAITINQIDPSQNNYILYAMWSGNYTIGALTYLQDFAGLNIVDKFRIISSMTVNEQYRLKDKRDNKDYWIALLEDGNIWMTQGLDLDLRNGTTLNHATSDIGWSENNPNKTWNPAATANTINFEGAVGTTVTGWVDDDNVPYSANGYGNNANEYVYIAPGDGPGNDDVWSSLAACKDAGLTEEQCSHYQVGNYYNFAAAAATNNVAITVGGSGYVVSDSDDGTIMPDSICPAGWRLPKGSTGVVKNGIARESNSELDALLYSYGVTLVTGATKNQNVGFTTGGLNIASTNPLYFNHSGSVVDGALSYRKTSGFMWFNTISDTSRGLDFAFGSTVVYPNATRVRGNGLLVRCLVR